MGRTGEPGRRSIVSIVKCDTYDQPLLKQSLHKCILPLLSNNAKFRKESKVLLKINLLSSSKGPDKPVNTHPSFIRSLAQIFKEDFGADVFMGDSTSSFSPGSTNKAFKNMGLDRLAKETGVGIVNFDTAKTTVIRNDNNRIIKEIVIPKDILEFDFIVSVPKLKTHELVGFTGAIKNMLGCIPGKMKRDVHVKAPTGRMMAEALCDIYNFLKPDFAVMDGIIGMEGNGPSAGIPVNTGLILASDDGVSLDAVVTHLLGFRDKEVLTTRIAADRGLGIGDLAGIEMIGERIENCYHKDFKKPSNNYKLILENIIPSFFLSKAIEKTVSYIPFIDNSKCVRCFECVKGCPANCIEDFKEKLIIDKKRCIECFCCQEVCPVNAVVIKPPLTKIMLGKIQKVIETISG